MARHENLTVGTLTVGTVSATLENVAGLVDSNGVDALTTGAAATPVNNLKVTNAATGSGPILEAVGTDTNVPITLKGKGTGQVIVGQATSGGIKLAADQALLDSSCNELAKFSKAATNAVNEVTVGNAVTGSGPTLTATGGDTNVPITLAQKGAAAVIVGAATCTGIKLGADQPILDSSDNELLKFTKAATDCVNELTISNGATGVGPSLAATGETNVPITLKGKGTGAVILGQATSTGVQLAADQAILDSSGNELAKFSKAATNAVNEITIGNAAASSGVSIAATGGDTNIGLTVKGKGTGTLQLGVATGSVAIATTGTDSVGFFGKAPATQTAVIAAHPTEWTQATTTEILAVSNKVNELIALMKTYGFVATE